MDYNNKIYLLQTARSGSKSVKNKNILNINGLPLYLYNILYAKKSKYIKKISIYLLMILLFQIMQTNIIIIQ